MSEILVYDSSNLKSKQQVYKNFFINASNGEPAYSPYYWLSSFLRVNYGDTVKCEGTFGTPNMGSFYDKSFKYISGIGNTGLDSITVPENAYYFRISSDIGKQMKAYVITDNPSLLNNDICEDTVIFNSETDEKMSGYKLVWNTGVVEANSGFDTTNFIPLNESSITMHGNLSGGFFSFYNNETYVSGAGTRGSEFTKDKPSNANSFKFCFPANTIAYVTTREITTSSVVEKTLTSIEANYTQGSTIIYPSTSINSLKSNLVVTANYSDGSTETIVDYELSGTLSVGTSTITVTYSDKTTTFTVNVTEQSSSDTFGNIISSVTSLSINEGSRGLFNVKLDKQPTNNQTVSISVNNNYCNVDKNSLTFTPSNYDTYQSVAVTAVHNSSNYNNFASVITLSSANVSDINISVTITNIDERPVISTSSSNNFILSEFARKNIKTLIFDSSKSNNIYLTFPRTFINNANGELMNINSDYVSIDFIRVDPGDIIELEGTFNKTAIGAYYNSKKEYLGKFEISDSSPYNVTVVENACYIRLYYINTSTCKIYITKNTANYTLENNVYLDSRYILYGNSCVIELLTKIYKRINRFKGKTWDVYGDSITELNFRSIQHYHAFIKDKLDLSTVNNYGVSGNGFKQLASTIDEKTSTPDLITVFCGTNNFGCIHEQSPLGELTDNSSAETVTGYIKLTIEKLITKYPNIPIGFFTPLPRSDGNSINNQTNSAGYTLEELVDRIIKICGIYSIPVLDLYRTSNLRPWNTTNKAEFFSSSQSVAGDGLHPNVKGHENFLQYKILNFIESYL